MSRSAPINCMRENRIAQLGSLSEAELRQFIIGRPHEGAATPLEYRHKSLPGQAVHRTQRPEVLRDIALGVSDAMTLEPRAGVRA